MQRSICNVAVPGKGEDLVEAVAVKVSVNSSSKLVRNRLLLHSAFRDTMSALKKANVVLPRAPVEEDMAVRGSEFAGASSKLERIEAKESYDLDAGSGDRIAHSGISMSAYDESINKFTALEGAAYLTSHSIVLVSPDRYLPINLLTFYFYTRSKDICQRSDLIKLSDNPSMDSERDYAEDKLKLLLEYVPEDSILFVDGPLIAGDVYVRVIRDLAKFHQKNILPVFFVKNSDSNLVTDHDPDLRGKFNSDLHYVHKLLKPGQRTSFYRYYDLVNRRNTKTFCYLKSFEASPVRIELHSDSFDKYRDRIQSLIDLIYYLLLVQGDSRNLQIRPIAVAEKFARETLKLVNLEEMMRWSGLIPTMNQERFAW